MVKRIFDILINFSSLNGRWLGIRLDGMMKE